jgi:hypothetical protein
METLNEHRKEVDFYQEIATGLKELFEANFPAESDIRIFPLIGEIRSAIGTLLANRNIEHEVIKQFSQEIDTLNLDVSFLLFNNNSHKFEIVVLEIKKMPSVGLTELSQLIGYCLVSKSKFGLLVNVDNLASNRFMTILEKDMELTTIERRYKGDWLTHKFGVMKWNSTTLSFEYSNAGSIKSIPELVGLVVSSLGE